jgi:hypothetical protein
MSLFACLTGWQLSRVVPVAAGFLCDKYVVLADHITGTVSTYAHDELGRRCPKIKEQIKMGHSWNDNWHGQTTVLGHKPATLPNGPPQIPYTMSWGQTWSSATKTGRLNAGVMTRPLYSVKSQPAAEQCHYALYFRQQFMFLEVK